jgi:hypothetical protein
LFVPSPYPSANRLTVDSRETYQEEGNQDEGAYGRQGAMYFTFGEVQ